MLHGTRSSRRTIIRSLVLTGLLVSAISGVIAAQADTVSQGESLFNQKCIGCHTIGNGNRVGPDLKGVSSRRDQAWLVKWISAPDQMIAANDPAAVELTKQFPNVVMPNLGLTDAEVEMILAYIDAQSGVPATAATSEPVLLGDVVRGKDYFTGRTGFAGGGPACIACHSVSGIGTLGGGQLGPDLTMAVNKYGGLTGLIAFLGNPPTKTMSVVWSTRALTPQERADLVAFLNQASVTGRPTNSILKLSVLAVAGAALFLALAQLIWRRRLRGVRRPMVMGNRG